MCSNPVIETKRCGRSSITVTQPYLCIFAAQTHIVAVWILIGQAGRLAAGAEIDTMKHALVYELPRKS
jgi:hypothetical protein